MTVWKRRIVFSVVVCSIGVGALLYVMRAPSPSVVALPVPNGYDSITTIPPFVLRPDEPPSRGDKDFSLARAKHYLTNNQAILPIVQHALTNQWAVPFQFSNDWLADHFSRDLPNAKKIAQLFSCAGYIAEQEGRLRDAAQLYVGGLNFGSAVARGGLIIDSLVSVADERIAIFCLDRIEPQLNSEDCRFVVAELQKWKSNRESFEAIERQETRWANIFGRLQVGFFRMQILRVAEMIKARSFHPEAQVIAKARAKHAAVLDQVQSLEVRLAVRAFELEHKTTAKSWADLVPVYLPVVPTNSQGRPLTHQF